MEILKSSPILTTEQFQIDLGQVLAIIGFNSFIYLTPFGNQTLSDVTEKKFRSVFFSGDVGSRIGEVFLLNSKLLRGDLANAKSISKYFELEAAFATAANDFKERETKNIRLPEPGKINSSYGFLANKRRSIRNYKKSPLRLEQLSTILHHAVGIKEGSREPIVFVITNNLTHRVNAVCNTLTVSQTP